MHDQRLTPDEYACVMEAIREHDLWWREGEPPRRIEPALVARGWEMVQRPGIEPFAGFAVRRGGRKVLLIDPTHAPEIHVTVKAHLLAHDVLGHEFAVDVIQPAAIRPLSPNPGVHPLDDVTAITAASLIMIPDWIAYSGHSAETVSRWCQVPTKAVVRRRAQLVVDDDPPFLIRINRCRRRDDAPDVIRSGSH